MAKEKNFWRPGLGRDSLSPTVRGAHRLWSWAFGEPGHRAIPANREHPGVDPKLKEPLDEARKKEDAKYEDWVVKRGMVTQIYAKKFNEHLKKLKALQTKEEIFRASNITLLKKDDALFSRMHDEMVALVKGRADWEGFTSQEMNNLSVIMHDMIKEVEKHTKEIDALFRADGASDVNKEVDNRLAEMKKQHARVRQTVMRFHTDIERYEKVSKQWSASLTDINDKIVKILALVQQYRAVIKASDAELAADTNDDASDKRGKYAMQIETMVREIQDWANECHSHIKNILQAGKHLYRAVSRDIRLSRRFEKQLERLGKEKVCRYNKDTESEIKSRIEKIKGHIQLQLDSEMDKLRNKYLAELNKQKSGGCVTANQTASFSDLQAELAKIKQNELAVQAVVNSELGVFGDLDKDLDAIKKALYIKDKAAENIEKETEKDVVKGVKKVERDEAAILAKQSLREFAQYVVLRNTELKAANATLADELKKLYKDALKRHTTNTNQCKWGSLGAELTAFYTGAVGKNTKDLAKNRAKWMKGGKGRYNKSKENRSSVRGKVSQARMHVINRLEVRINALSAGQYEDNISAVIAVEATGPKWVGGHVQLSVNGNNLKIDALKF